MNFTVFFSLMLLSELALEYLNEFLREKVVSNLAIAPLIVKLMTLFPPQV